MSGRDLLYKPQVPQYQVEEPTAKEDPKAKAKAKAKAQNKIGPQQGGRELGRVADPNLQRLMQAQQAQQAKGPQIHKHAYFNKDVSGVRQANLNASGLKALRGSEEATNLRKVVLPPAIGVDHPEPEVLRGALDLMGAEAGFSESFEGLLGRQGAWAKSKGMTMEMLEQRMAQLEEMVEARKAALGRMANGRSDQPVTSVTVLHAATVAGSGTEDVEDVGSAGTELIQKTSDQALGMHARLAKMFGLKMQ